MILFWGLVILGAIALVRWLWMSGKGSGKDSGNASRKTALDILQERYARGEIEREEYERKRRDLEDQSARLTGQEGSSRRRRWIRGGVMGALTAACVISILG